MVDALSDIPRHATHHDTKARFKNGPKAPYDPRKPAFTLTRGGGENNHHPSGLRNPTAREMAALQTFPHHHSFADNSNTAARKQIGNAVPPKLAKELFKAVIKSLKASDQEEVFYIPISISLPLSPWMSTLFSFPIDTSKGMADGIRVVG